MAPNWPRPTTLALLCAGCATSPAPTATPSEAAAKVAVPRPAPEAIAAVEAPLPEPPEPEREVHLVGELSLRLELPSAAWKPHRLPPQPGAQQVGFARDLVHDDAGNAVQPFCGITSEELPSGTNEIVLYSAQWRTRMPFQVDEVFSHEDGTVQLKNVIGYRGRTSHGGDEHTLLVLHGLFQRRGFVVVCDATTAVFPRVRGEMESFLRSLQHAEAP
jgi:hypothetical protein